MSVTTGDWPAVAEPGSPEAARLVTADTPIPTACSPGLLTGVQLDALRIAPLRYAVAGLVPEGLSVLAGPPSLGKS